MQGSARSKVKVARVATSKPPVGRSVDFVAWRGDKDATDWVMWVGEWVGGSVGG